MPDPVWTTPKTNWVGTDRFYAADWFRITGNIQYLLTYTPSGLISFLPRNDVENGKTPLTANDRNYIVETLDAIYDYFGSSWNKGYVKPKVDYGSAWNSADLNTIENLTLCLYKQAQGDPEYTSGYEYFAGDGIYANDSISTGLL